jgi:hypothetical protein
MKLRSLPALLALLLVLPCAVSALSVTDVDVNVSALFIGSNPLGGLVDPTLGIAPLIGVSVPLRLSAPFFLEPGLEFLGWYYDWTGSNAQITQAENGLGFFTIGALLSMQAGVAFPVSPVISLGGALGLDFLFRFPLELQNTSPNVQADEGNALGWFYGAGRFFYPETRFFFRWHIIDPLDLVVNLRAFYPVFHLWDRSGQPFWDALMVSGGVGFAVRLGPSPAAPAPAAPAAAAPAEPAPAK